MNKMFGVCQSHKQLLKDTQMGKIILISECCLKVEPLGYRNVIEVESSNLDPRFESKFGVYKKSPVQKLRSHSVL